MIIQMAIACFPVVAVVAGSLSPGRYDRVDLHSIFSIIMDGFLLAMIRCLLIHRRLLAVATVSTSDPETPHRRGGFGIVHGRNWFVSLVMDLFLGIDNGSIVVLLEVCDIDAFSISDATFCSWINSPL